MDLIPTWYTLNQCPNTPFISELSPIKCFVTNDPSIQDIILINVQIVYAMGVWWFNNNLIIETIMIEFFLDFSTLEKFQTVAMCLLSFYLI